MEFLLIIGLCGLGFLIWVGKTKSSPKVYKDPVETMWTTCNERDRSQSFDDWVSDAIKLMAIDEMRDGKADPVIYAKLKEERGDLWDLFYPLEKVRHELSKPDSYWTGLKKFDDKVAKDNGEVISPSLLDKLMLQEGHEINDERKS